MQADSFSFAEPRIAVIYLAKNTRPRLLAEPGTLSHWESDGFTAARTSQTVKNSRKMKVYANLQLTLPYYRITIIKTQTQPCRIEARFL